METKGNLFSNALHYPDDNAMWFICRVKMLTRQVMYPYFSKLTPTEQPKNLSIQK
jgi:hypothetical protein